MFELEAWEVDLDLFRLKTECQNTAPITDLLEAKIKNLPLAIECREDSLFKESCLGCC